MSGEFSALSREQIKTLEDNGCTCHDWGGVEVVQDFDAAKVRWTHFSGNVRLGRFEKMVEYAGGVKKPAGISYATIHNCNIGHNVCISHVKNYIANYNIEDDVIIDNIDLLAVEGDSSFGNGVEVSVVNEAGGREIAIYDRLSAQQAYVMAFYRHRKKLIENIRAMINNYTNTVRSSMGVVGKGSKLTNCRIIKNVKIGPACVIEAVNRLENGSINSCAEDPVYVGPGVFAHDFIFCSGSKVTDGAIVSKCFVGQGTELAKQYSAEESAFFANCGGFHGEACAIFAGPYTVTHHKSTLLIAGLFSFTNAGSGTNQSNHMYKLGPAHQGVVERGSKTASDSYILWPARVGAFSVVMGRHYRNSDTSDLPFSYLIEHEDESVLVPGVNLRSVGTVRDARKWPRRDRRKTADKLDQINFKLLSPYTVQKMIKGLEILRELKRTCGEGADYYTYHSVKINRSSLEKGIDLYETGIEKFLGNCLISRLEAKRPANPAELRAALKPDSQMGRGCWLDLAGLFAPEQVVQQLLDDIESGAVDSLEKTNDRFRHIHRQYAKYEWSWAAMVLEKKLGRKIEEITAKDIIDIVQRWKQAVVELDRKLYQDARKEFSERAQIGYGVDGDEEIKHLDFNGVRGTFENNSFVGEIENHITTKTRLAGDMIRWMENLGATSGSRK